MPNLRQDVGKKEYTRYAKKLGWKVAGALGAYVGKKARTHPVSAAALQGFTAGAAASQDMEPAQGTGMPAQPRREQARLQLKKGAQRARNNPRAYYPVGHSRPDGGMKSAPNHY